MEVHTEHYLIVLTPGVIKNISEDKILAAQPYDLQKC
jgi:hypothetical protein